jgi:hypothetical protein
MREDYVPLGGRRLAVEIVFAGIVVIAAVAIVSGLFELSLLNRIIAGEQVSNSELDNNDIRQGIVGLLQFLTYVTAAVVFIVWLHRAYKNVDAVAPEERRYKTGWAIGGWFVPFLNLWRPKQIVNDVWRAGAQPSDVEGREPGGLLLTWWLLWIATGVAGQIGTRIYLSEDTAEEIRGGTIAYLVSDSIDLVTAILAIVVVRAATGRLEERAATPGAGWEAPERPAGTPA